jgi:MFS family permease
MNQDPENQTSASAGSTSARTEFAGNTTPSPGSPPLDWREALLTLIASRISIIQIESKEAARAAAGRLAYLIGIVICIFFAWALFLAGGIAALAAATSWSWFWIAMAVAALHLVAAALLSRAAKAPAKPSFTHTRAEFQKDREWIENFQKTRKSND